MRVATTHIDSAARCHNSTLRAAVNACHGPNYKLQMLRPHLQLQDWHLRLQGWRWRLGWPAAAGPPSSACPLPAEYAQSASQESLVAQVQVSFPPFDKHQLSRV